MVNRNNFPAKVSLKLPANVSIKCKTLARKKAFQNPARFCLNAKLMRAQNSFFPIQHDMFSQVSGQRSPLPGPWAPL